MLCDCNGRKAELFASIYWRASLVPAAAVIPAPIAYIKIAAVKASVVEFRSTQIDADATSVVVLRFLN